MIDTQRALQYLSPESPLTRDISSFERREGQEEMISIICDALNTRQFSVIEAGTGIGKSFAYLIPVILSAGEFQDAHVVISTGTINLQYQLYEKDLPFLCSRIDPTVTAALLMGRTNYICLRRLHYEVDKQPLLRDLSDDPMSVIYRWSQESIEGVRTELEQRIPQDAWSKVCSDADFCLGYRCPEKGECYVNRARRRASEAQIIVVNHHVLFSDVLLKMEGDSFEEDGLLPAYRTVICDEAHRIEEGARQYFSGHASRGQVMKILSHLWNARRDRDQGLLQKLKNHSADPQAWEAYAPVQENVIISLEEIEKVTETLLGKGLKHWIRSEYREQYRELLGRIGTLVQSLESMLSLLSRIGDSIEHEDDEDAAYLLSLFTGQCRKLRGVTDLFSRFKNFDQDKESIFWVEKRPGQGSFITYTVTPHSAAPILREALFSNLDTFIAVSATLTVNNSFGYWRKALGIEERNMLEGIIPSPFDYKQNVMLAIPTDAPPVENPEAYAEYLKSALFELVTLCEGRTMVLFTSFQLLRDVHDYLKVPLEGEGIESLVQLPGSDRHRLLASFKENRKQVLFATDSFWEGVDVPGEALTQVVITRLPFQVPVDPVYLARQERIQQEGGNPFLEMAVPRAAMKLKQGFGRLIRKTDDRGVVLILDKRLLTKFYGRYLLGSLPETYQVFTDHDGILRRVESFLFP